MASALRCLALVAGLVACASTKRPNVLFIVTDDQDSHMESVEHMPRLQKHLVSQGTTFNNHHCTVAICCPSRVNIWTGRAAHNTNVTDVLPPYGGFPKIVQEGINDDYLPLWLQRAGYNTYYIGKLWNGHTVDNYNAPFARGFTGSDFLLDPYTYQYLNAWMSRNGEPPVSYKDQYSPDVIAEKAKSFLYEAAAHDEPWMLTVAPIAPHADTALGEDGKAVFATPVPAERHAHLFQDYKIPRTENFNPQEHGGVSWMKGLPLLNDTVIEYNDEFQRARLRSLQSVDEMVGDLVQILDDQGLLENTYIFYTSDNGFHISQHRLHPGKECGFDTDIKVPFIVRGPGVAAGHISDHVTSHTDIAPTLLKLASTTRDDLDGSAIPLTAAAYDEAPISEHVNIEFWGVALPEGRWGEYGNAGGATIRGGGPNNTYKGLRIVAQEYSIYYSVWCSGDREYYDSKRDPGQLRNYFTNAVPPDDYQIAGRRFDQIVHRLDALMMVLKSCRGAACRRPWSVLHPAGDVRTLLDALAPVYDGFYRAQPKVSFSSCQLGYLRDEEGPQDANVYHDPGRGFASGGSVFAEGTSQKTFHYDGHWSLWT